VRLLLIASEDRFHVWAVISVLDQVEAMEKGSAAGKQESKITVRRWTRQIDRR
jgi:hypothetical protein